MDLKFSTLGFDKIYVINLKHRKDRKEKLIKDNPGINFTFVEALYGKDLNVNQLIKEKKLNTSFFDPMGMVTMNIFACALSHKKAWDQALADGVENALFLEDDIFFSSSFIDLNNKCFTPLYKDILLEANQYDWDILQLGKKTPYQNGIFVGKYFVVPRYRSNFNGAHAYAVTRETLKTMSNQCLPIECAADVYLEKFYNTHNSLTLKESLIRQVSDVVDPQDSDSDTYYNDYRLGGGNVGISFDEKGNVINKKLAKYIKHPKDILQQNTEVVLERPKFGLQKFNKSNFFGLSSMLKYLSKHLDKNSQMIELYSHFGESTFFFGCSGLFKNIYAIDPLKGEDKWNLSNNITWEDVEIGFHSNTYFFDNINHIKNPPEQLFESFKDISFIYINNRKNKDIKPLIDLYFSSIKKEGFIGGNGKINFTPTKTFKDGSWLIKKENYEF